MDIENEAFTTPIEEGDARILLKLESITAEVENAAPDFISIANDEVSLNIGFPNDADIEISAFTKAYPVEFRKTSDDSDEVVLAYTGDAIWFDIKIDQIKDIWVSDLVFDLQSNSPRYVAYYIKTLDHQFEWLQPDIKTGEIKSMSVTKKKFKTPKISGKESFSAVEVIRCADMLGRAVKKIDLRTQGAFVKFNTDKGRLEPLIIGMAEKLGYDVEPLTPEEIRSMEASGENVSHSIYLSKNG